MDRVIEMQSRAETASPIGTPNLVPESSNKKSPIETQKKKFL